jgi:SNF2 family DNA or RNA helicase
VYPDTKQIVVPYRADIENILREPNAKKFQHAGAWWLAVDHNIISVRLLRNLGFKAPSPALSYYDYCGGTPFESQRATVDMCTVHRRAYVLSEMGVGKTRAVLWAYDYLKREGLVDKLLVVGPLSTLTTVWENEIFENFHHLKAVVLYGDKKRRARLLAQDADIYIINFDGVGVLERELRARPDLNCIIVDEVASYRNSRAERWKCLAPLVKRAGFAWGLSGSPTPNSPTDAFGIARLITPETAGFSFKAFKDRTMRQVGPFQWLERPEATSIVHSILQPAVRFTREQCFDLPPTTYTTITCDPGPVARGAYKAMYDAFAAEMRGHEITAANAGVKLSKLLQISAGFAYNQEGRGIYIGGVDRVKQIIEIIEGSQGKVIVFAAFRYMVEILAGVLGNKYTVGKIHGEVSKAQRDLIFQQFQKETSPRVLVAHPQTMSHGLTLTSASTIVWATPTTSLEIYEQANARITRSGQQRNTLIVNIAATPAEQTVYSRLKKRSAMQGALLDLFEADSHGD